MADLALFPSPDGITITEDPDRDCWDVALPSGRSHSFGRSMFRTESDLRAFARRVYIEKGIR
ncbi:hypothetical protein GV791_14760 [Nocardia cyriacigeorgica]|uniref:Uncharacterized protein n=1 Tax=Nocardia cyriacigeorgica TaxID=135487 RepID=A0A6P1CRD2_9NOCA|nr:hypothetical protein [Nocardia cyriacigeorgica]NEW33816.1 hypothetical protein [Nocardia cyriacigeorgica]